jgi:hypothetical protein
VRENKCIVFDVLLNLGEFSNRYCYVQRVERLHHRPSWDIVSGKSKRSGVGRVSMVQVRYRTGARASAQFQYLLAPV